MNKRVLVIVVTYNGMRWLERCLGSVSAPGGHNFVPPGAVTVDLYVFDNDSTDGSADYVAAHFPQAKLVRSAENLGFSRPNNLGMQWALDHGYDYVYLLNQDAWLEPGALEKLVAASEAHPDYAVLSPLQMTDGFQALDHQFEKIMPKADVPSLTVASRPLPTVCASRTRGPLPLMKPRVAQVLEGTSASGIIEVQHIMAAHWLVPVEALKRLGLFEAELFPHWGQDDEWCNRARYAGLKLGVVRAARAVHDRACRKEPVGTLVKRNYYTGSLVRLANVNRPLWWQFAYVIPFALVKAVRCRSWLPFKYLQKIFDQLPAVKALRISVRTRIIRAL